MPASTASSLSDRIDSIAQDIKLLTSEALQDEDSRKRLLNVLQDAVQHVESPAEVIWKLTMPLNIPASLEVILQLGIVHDICTAKEPRTAKELSDSSGGGEELIIRLMRPLCAAGIFREVALHTYASTAVTEELISGPLAGGFQFMFEYCTYPLANMPRYLKRTGYKDPGSAPGPFQDAYQTPKGMFEWIAHNDRKMVADFNAFMVAALGSRKNWFEAFPVQEIFLEGATRDPESTLVVDIAGGEGVDIEAFHRTFPEAPGKLVLQEVKEVIENIKSLDDAVVRQQHDMFQPQPVKGARVYYLGHVLHHWADRECATILSNLAQAMEPGYSKVLIFDWILPDEKCPLYPAFRDINMMAAVNGKERTRSDWEAVIKDSGLALGKIWEGGPDAEGLIEAFVQR